MRRIWLLAALAGCHAQCARPGDDRFEPNNDAAHATPLARDTPVQARSVEGDVDAWAIEARAGEHLVITVAPMVMFGHIAVLRPDGAPVADAQGRTRDEAGWHFDLHAAVDGTYVVTVLQGSAADNQFWFKWDYTIEVR